MSKKLALAVACLCACLTFGLAVTDADARTSYRGGGGASASRGCLTSAARALLSRIEAQFGAMQIISTCRPGARIRGTGKISKHASGQAIDFNAGSRKAAVVRWLIANHHSGGTMTYRGMSHIHVDIGYHFVSLGSGGSSYAKRSRGKNRIRSNRGTRFAARSTRSRTSRVARSSRRGTVSHRSVRSTYRVAHVSGLALAYR
jgi:hypothetical protein